MFVSIVVVSKNHDSKHWNNVDRVQVALHESYPFVSNKTELSSAYSNLTAEYDLQVSISVCTRNGDVYQKAVPILADSMISS